MSIGFLLLAEHGEQEDQLIPVASESVFIRYWKPAAAQLKLRWLSRLQTGCLVASADVPPIQRELDLMRRHLIETQPDAETTHQIVARISVLSRELSVIIDSPSRQAFLGPVGLPFIRRALTTPMRIMWTSPVPTVIQDPIR